MSSPREIDEDKKKKFFLRKFVKGEQHKKNENENFTCFYPTYLENYLPMK